MHTRSSCTALLAILVSACAAFPEGDATRDDPDDQTVGYEGRGESLDIDDAKADQGGEIRVRAEGLTVWVRPVIEARDVGGETRFVIRGRASRNLESVLSFVPDGAFGSASVVGRRGFEIELRPHETSTFLAGLPLLASLRAPGAPHDDYFVQLRGRARLVQVTGAPSGVQLVLAGVALTHLDPYDAWPEVDAHAERFATDLREQLASWYVLHAADAAAAGGNDLAMAQAAVSAEAVREITSTDEDPLGHDLTMVRVLSHPDPVFPGSDRVWLGAYDRATDALLEIVDFE